MKVHFLYAEKPRERILAEAFLEGVKAHGDQASSSPLTPEKTVVDCDVACMVGVKSRELFAAYTKARTHVIYLDKGYSRHKVDSSSMRVWEYWRVAVDAHHPTKYLANAKNGPDRWDQLGFTLKPWRKSGTRVILAGSSQKYHDFYRLSDPTRYWSKVMRRLQRINPNFYYIYRPKPSWKDAVPIVGATYTTFCNIEEELQDSFCMITHGSNACFEALLMGIPCIVLGDAVAKPISSTQLEDINNIRVPTNEERQQLFNNLAYMQWTQPEMLSGEAWSHIKPQIFG